MSAYSMVTRWLWSILKPKQQVILFLAANPDGVTHLRLAEECDEIQRELRMTALRDEFQLESRWAVSVDGLMRHVMELDPTVIHLGGHGGADGGVVLQDESGRAQRVSAAALAMMIAAAGRNVRLLVLNACYGTRQAGALLSAVEAVVCMDGAIGDDAARAFAVRFYGALGHGRSVGNAVAHGVAALTAKQLPDAVLPRCVTRPGTDARELYLTGASEQADALT
jgi:hypothetical protein